MSGIDRHRLLSLEAYARVRAEFRKQLRAHKGLRRVHLGDHLSLQFEDELTMRYQVQEMLHSERIFEEEGIQAEIDAYAPLVPDGSNFKATLMIEYDDPDVRRRALGELVGIERRVWIRAEGGEKVFAIADEDLDRETEGKTSAVHFLRFELDAGSKATLLKGGALAVGVDHPHYTAALSPLPEATRAALVKDLS
jgi:hypothetical protein